MLAQAQGACNENVAVRKRVQFVAPTRAWLFVVKILGVIAPPRKPLVENG
jgi:hypothetical protein